MSTLNLFKLILIPRNQSSTYLFSTLKITLSLLFIIQILIILFIFMITIIQFNFIFDHLISFGLFMITFFGIGYESLQILTISTIYFMIYFFDSFFNLNYAIISYLIMFFNAFGLFFFTYLTFKYTFKDIVEASQPDE